jgi:hypothetical protein
MLPALAIPFLPRDGGKPDFARLKPDHPRVEKRKDGTERPRKYEQPKGVPVRPYFPPGFWALVSSPANPLLITEGEKKAAKAVQEGFACVGLVGVECFSVRRKKDPDTGKPVGKRKLLPELEALTLKERKVFIAYDSDAAEKKEVRRAEQALAGLLQTAGAEVLVVRLPPAKGGGKVGLDDFLVARGAEELRKLMADARPAINVKGRTLVVLSPDEHEVALKVTTALANDDHLFQRAGEVLRLRVVEEAEQARFPVGGRKLRWERPAGMMALRSAEAAFVRLRITKTCCLCEIKGKNKEMVPAHPPAWLAPALMAEPGAIRAIDGILPGPTLASDGRLIDRPGYDEATCWFLSRSLPGLSVPNHPHLEDAKEAAGLLWELVSDFPFETDADYSRWLALLLTACCRHLIERTPVGLITANVAGAGKTYLARLISIVAHGLRTPILMAWPEDGHLNSRGDEIRKRLASLLHEGASLALIDNLPRGEDFGCSALDAFVTADAFHDRQLGKNDGSRVGGPNRCLLIATGNNIRPHGDTADRTLLVRLNSGDPNPRTRPVNTFKIPDIEEHALAERARYLGAALTIWHAWIRAGCPQPEGPSWGTFGSFVSSAVAAVRWLGRPDPLGDRMKTVNSLDREAIALQTLLGLWRRIIGTDPVTCSELIALLSWDTPLLNASDEESEMRAQAMAMRDALGILSRAVRWPPSVQRLGTVLLGQEGRAVQVENERLRLRNEENKRLKTHRYTVESVQPAGSAGIAGTGCYSPRVGKTEENGTATHPQVSGDSKTTPHYPHYPQNGRQGTLGFPIAPGPEQEKR